MHARAAFRALLALAAAAGAAHPTRAEDAPPRETLSSTGMAMVRIVPGAFTMGQGDAPPRSREEWLARDADEAPARRVTISRPFLLGACEVTNAQFERFDPGHARWRGRDGVSPGDDDPAVFVTWAQAAAFCDWLAAREGKPCRLPTEAEWEYACRAGTTTPYNTGDAIAAEQANLGLSPDGKPLKTVPAGRYPSNAWGLHDMHGNVAEWCLDWYGPYEAGEAVDPVGRADGIARVVRGWSYLTPDKKGPPRHARSANRSGHLPEDANRCTGFRVAVGERPATPPLPVVVPPHQADVRQGPPPVREPSKPDAPPPPRFVNYTREGLSPAIPRDAWGPVFRQHNHFAAVCVCPNGDVLAAWYTTVTEEGRELAQAASRLRAGADRWEPASSFLDVPDVNDHAPVLFCDGRRVYHFFTQSLRGWDDAADWVRVSDDSGATWSKPSLVVPRDAPGRLSQPCSAFRAKDGTLVLACDGDGHRDERLVTSADDGRTWAVARGDMRKAAGNRYVIHPAAVPCPDGAVLAFLRGPDPMPVARSIDLGATWEVRDTTRPGISVGQKAAALRLSGGALLLCSFDNGKKPAPGLGAVAALSFDNGATWPRVKRLEGVDGYLAAAQAPDGMIYVVGSRATCVAFDERWLREGP
jgi:formylglycine-generating enzyme required for sulfatase activity